MNRSRECFALFRTIGITGGRDRKPTRDQRRAMGALLGRPQDIPTHIVHGNAKGIDKEVSRRASRKCFLTSPVDAKWVKLDAHVAGPLRNAIIVRVADFIVTFGGRAGTMNTVWQALAYGTPIVDLSGLGPRNGEDITVLSPAGRRRKKYDYAQWKGATEPGPAAPLEEGID